MIYLIYAQECYFDEKSVIDSFRSKSMMLVSKGGQGTIYQLLKALTPALEKELILKVHNEDSLEGVDKEITIYETMEELKAVAPALKRSVIKYHGCFEEEYNLNLKKVIVLEKLGKDLQSLSGRIRALNLELRFSLYLKFAQLIKAIHDVHITHCDLSIKNILAADQNLSDFRLVDFRLVDFGFARYKDSKCEGGTLGFFIPSQHNVDLPTKHLGKQDIFSLAVIMLILESPLGTRQTFADRISNKKYDFSDIYEQIAKKNLPSFEPSNSFFAFCSSTQKSTKELLYIEFNKLFKGMLRKSPADRPTISEVILVLESMLEKIRKLANKGVMNII